MPATTTRASTTARRPSIPFRPVARGFSIRTCTPASARAVAIGTSAGAGVATTATSGGSRSADSRSAAPRATPYRPATAPRSSAFTSASRTSARPVCWKQRRCRSPIEPTPTTRTLGSVDNGRPSLPRFGSSPARFDESRRARGYTTQQASATARRVSPGNLWQCFRAAVNCNRHGGGISSVEVIQRHCKLIPGLRSDESRPPSKTTSLPPHPPVVELKARALAASPPAGRSSGERRSGRSPVT
jgi:hypothetical protein